MEGPRTRVACVVPARNEAANIGQVVSGVREVLRDDVTVIVVDDASDDDTGRVAREAGALVARNPFSLGYGGAVQTGMRVADRLDADVVVTLDGDGQHDVRDIPVLLEPVLDGTADVVVGCRYREGGTKAAYAVPFSRRAGHRFLSMLVRLFTGRTIRDATSGYQALGRKAVAFTLSNAWPADYPDADVLIAYSFLGLRICEREVGFRPPPAPQRSMHAGPWKPIWYLYSMAVAFLRLSVTAVNGRVY